MNKDDKTASKKMKIMEFDSEKSSAVVVDARSPSPALKSSDLIVAPVAPAAADGEERTAPPPLSAVADSSTDEDEDENNLKSIPTDTSLSQLIDPFVAYKDGYEWPNLYSELQDMLEACILIYPLAELRRKAREEADKGIVPQNIDSTSSIKPTSLQRVLIMPLTHKQVMDVVDANKSILEDTRFGHTEDEDDEISAITSPPAGGDRIGNSFHYHTLLEAQYKNNNMTPCSIVAVDDEYEEQELVYSVQVNHIKKRITICFRGSVTKLDWATNFQTYMNDVPNPMASHSTQDDTVRVHSGFYDYLFTPSSRGGKGPNGEALSEYSEILYHHILPILKQYPKEYKVYVTGHSLGAALATLFAWKLSSESDKLVPKPVSLFSIAGPYVGDSQFRSSHQLMEMLGKLRHVRVSNHKDIVTIVPKMSFKWNIFDSSSHVGCMFKHVGVNLRLYSTSSETSGNFAVVENTDENAPKTIADSLPPTMQISYPRVRTGFVASTYDEFARGWDQSFFSNISWNPKDYFQWPWHSLKEYKQRIEDNKATLETMHVNDIYARPEVVGQLLAQF